MLWGNRGAFHPLIKRQDISTKVFGKAALLKWEWGETDQAPLLNISIRAMLELQESSLLFHSPLPGFWLYRKIKANCHILCHPGWILGRRQTFNDCCTHWDSLFWFAWFCTINELWILLNYYSMDLDCTFLRMCQLINDVCSDRMKYY